MSLRAGDIPNRSHDLGALTDWRSALRSSVILAVLVATLCCSFCVGGAMATSTNCLAIPSACGYPDATNTGVPSGTTLTASGSRTVTTNGQVLNGLDITGTVVVAADNVTIENSRITRTSGGSGTYGVTLNDGADDFTIKNSEVVGPNSQSSGLQSAVWNHYGNPGATASHDYFHRCADCWEGSGVFENDYMVVDAAYSGSHDEDIYVCGAEVDVNHSTLINTHHQTATVFGDTTNGCGGNTFNVTNSLIAGGGYMLYPQANSSSRVGTMNVSGNRFARCISGEAYDSSTGGTNCANGTGDAFGYFPFGGYYGVAAYVYSGAGNVWTNNVWDNNSQPVCADGSNGCGTAAAPPKVPPPVAPVQPPPTAPPPKVPPKASPPVSPPVSPVQPPPTAPSSQPTLPKIEPTKPVAGAKAVTTAPPVAPVAAAMRAVWKGPNSVWPGVRFHLEGAASTGSTPIECTWSVESRPGSRQPATRTGCGVSLRAPGHGVLFVRLTVETADGASASTQHAIRVGSGPVAHGQAL